jgi:hypothetical protein
VCTVDTVQLMRSFLDSEWRESTVSTVQSTSKKERVLSTEYTLHRRADTEAYRTVRAVQYTAEKQKSKEQSRAAE